MNFLIAIPLGTCEKAKPVKLQEVRLKHVSKTYEYMQKKIPDPAAVT